MSSQKNNEQPFYALHVAKNTASNNAFYNASDADINMACEKAEDAFWSFCETTRMERAAFLDKIADNILALGDTLLETTELETGLPNARLQGERARTVNQLKLFSNLLRNETEAIVVDEADPNREPMPKPMTRLEYIAIGPVAVFSASNFPYAFSVLGGDTASALAAGCSVVVKAHPAHPETSELMAGAIKQAIQDCQLPTGVFTLLQGEQPRVSHNLVGHPAIKAVGFTGSIGVAKVLQESIAKRPVPIPFYGELGSVNPQFILPSLCSQDSAGLAESLIQSLMMGQGQFCTSPGIWFVPAGSEAFLTQIKESLEQQASSALLTRAITDSFKLAIDNLNNLSELTLVAENKPEEDFHPKASIYKTDVGSFSQLPELNEEVFGPCALIVEYNSPKQLTDIVNNLEGQLTASIHGNQADLQSSDEIIARLKHKVGRLIYNQMPTGVEVCASMNHGGPYPASTDVRSTSVGSKAIERFLRPLCIQNQPSKLS